MAHTEAAYDSEYSPLVIAHRGASAVEPEHTFSSYDQAMEDRADYIEIDLRRTADGELIAMHDDTVDRTTNGKGLVEELTLKEIKALDTGKGQMVPTLKEILIRYGSEVQYYIETREDDKGKLVMERQVLQLLKQYAIPKDQVILQSFSKDSIRTLHELDPELTLVQLLKKKDVEQLNGKDLQEIRGTAIGVGIYAGILEESVVDLIQHHDLEIHAYYRGDEREWTEEMLHYEVDGIFSDDPAFLASMMEKKE
ncbi:glycerophosphodiester phosphodiesterase family protein [Virgibacillus sp. 7505]|uniref:glycerophosphodiester phosphodiesterase family protein n=1 Tax=Virgibacillus sp. 7505 TaxID=2022548 RepID=UPI0015955C59|nr:glycerophosphodiester phosphodiesterase family protein [Virgibacillus sp. 7505]